MVDIMNNKKYYRRSRKFDIIGMYICKKYYHGTRFRTWIKMVRLPIVKLNLRNCNYTDIIPVSKEDIKPPYFTKTIERRFINFNI